MQTEKNRYYHGKMLRSDDFLCEQSYLCDQIKTRTHIFYGEGILCGLQLKKVQNERLQVSKGYALDASGNVIQVKEDQLFSIEELRSYSKLNAMHGYITLSYKEIKTTKCFSEFSNTKNHEEYDRIEETWELGIHEHIAPDIIQRCFFHSHVLYEDDEVSITILLAELLPEQGDIHITIQTLVKQPIHGEFSFILQSSHYQKQSVHDKFSILNTIHETHVRMIRDSTKKGTYVNFQVDKLSIRKNTQQTDYDIYKKYETVIYANMEEEIVRRVCQNDFIYHKQIILGYVEFSYQNDCLVIDAVDTKSRTLVHRPMIDRMVKDVMQRIGHVPSVQEYPRMPEVSQRDYASGCIPVITDGKEEVFHSDEIHHGLGPGNVTIQIGIETRQRQDNYEYHKQVYFGDTSLFTTDEHAWQYGIRTYPHIGSFQIALRVGKQMDEKLYIRWYAKKWEEHLSINQNTVQLLRIQPAAITLSPLDSCKFVAVFDRQVDIQHVRFTISDEQGGEISEDGNFQAGKQEGIFQINATYDEQIVQAYVKVKNIKRE